MRQGATLGGLRCEPGLAPVLGRGGGGGELGMQQGGGRRVTGPQPRGRGTGQGSGRRRTAGSGAAGMRGGKADRQAVAVDEAQRLEGRRDGARAGRGRAGRRRGAAGAEEAAERHCLARRWAVLMCGQPFTGPTAPHRHLQGPQGGRCPVGQPGAAQRGPGFCTPPARVAIALRYHTQYGSTKPFVYKQKNLSQI